MGRKDDKLYMEYLRSLKKPVKKSSKYPPTSYNKRKAYYSESESDSDSCSDCSQSESDSESDYSD